MLNKKGFIDLEEINLFAVGLGFVAGLISVIIADRMGAGIFIKITGFLVAAVIGFFISSKIADSG